MTDRETLLPNGVDVAIAAFLGARFSGKSTEQARKDAEAMLDFFGIERARASKDQTQ